MRRPTVAHTRKEHVYSEKEFRRASPPFASYRTAANRTDAADYCGYGPAWSGNGSGLAFYDGRDFPGSDPRNYHAHLLATTRDITREGLGAKTTLELGDGDRGKLGLKPAIYELLHVRERWATVTNEALHAANVAARVAHRPLLAQGIDREPRPQIPRAAFEMERQGYRSVVAERMREEYAERVKSRVDRMVGRETSFAAKPHAAAKPQSLEEIRREARENWLRMRQNRVQSAGAAPAKTTDRARDDDLAQ